jgi:hypothetical protein
LRTKQIAPTSFVSQLLKFDSVQSQFITINKTGYKAFSLIPVFLQTGTLLSILGRS